MWRAKRKTHVGPTLTYPIPRFSPGRRVQVIKWPIHLTTHPVPDNNSHMGIPRFSPSSWGRPMGIPMDWWLPSPSPLDICRFPWELREHPWVPMRTHAEIAKCSLETMESRGFSWFPTDYRGLSHGGGESPASNRCGSTYCTLSDEC